MPAITPLNNIKLQSSLNLKNQLLLNTNIAKAYTLKYIETPTKTLNASDIGSLLFFGYYGSPTLVINTNIPGVFAGDSVFITSPYTFFIAPAASVIDSMDETIDTSFFQLIYVGSNIWIKINTN